MASLTQSPRPPVHLSLLRFIHDRNPFYLLSALCLFVGFRVIVGAIEAAGQWKTLLLLIVTLNVYEAMLIGLALLLILRRGLQRDGWILLSIEALFLVDLANLNAELFTAAPRLGAVVNGICFLLSLVKMLVVVRSLRLRLTVGTRFYIAAQFAFLLGLPGIFRWMRSSDGNVSALQIYGIWWMAAGLIAGGSMLVKRSQENIFSPMHAVPWRLYVMVPMVSMLVHLASENRVYWVHFHAANLGPVVLAMAVVVNRSWGWRQRGAALPVSIGLAAMSFALSVVSPVYRPALTTHIGRLELSPLRIELYATALLMIWLAWRYRSLIAAQIASACFVLSGLGSNIPEMAHRATILLRWCLMEAKRMIPETTLQWGYFAVGSAFVLLGIGAVVSLKWPHSGTPTPPLEQELV